MPEEAEEDRMRRSSFTLAFCLMAAALYVSPQAQAPTTIAIRGVTLIDGTGRAPVPNAIVVIEGTQIKDAGANVQAPAGARIIDGTGKFMIPGMIDAHIHLRGGGGRSTSQPVTPE
jgi:imidazolonepropionase-like amidohydrolase